MIASIYFWEQLILQTFCIFKMFLFIREKAQMKVGERQS